MTKTMKKFLIGAGVLLSAGQAMADEPVTHGVVEVMAGQESATLDTKLIIPLGSDTTFFNRNRMTAAYEGAESLDDVGASSYHVNSLSHDVGHYFGVPGLEVLAGVDVIPGTGLDPYAGTQYFGSVGDLKIYQLAIVGMHENPDLTLITNLSYQPQLTDSVGLLVEADNLTVVNEEGHLFSTQKLRAGVSIGDVKFGVATDLVEAGQSVAADEVGYNIGGFIRYSK
jgi:hypothetical protein